MVDSQATESHSVFDCEILEYFFKLNPCVPRLIDQTSICQLRVEDLVSIFSYQKRFSWSTIE